MVPRCKSGASKSRPCWAVHARIGNVWEYPPLPGVDTSFCESLSNRGFYRIRKREMQKPPSQTLSAGIFILNSNPDLNYLKMKCQRHLKIQPAQVEQTKEGESNQKLLPHHLQLKKNHQAQNEGKNEKFIYCHSFMLWNNAKEITHPCGCIMAISQCTLYGLLQQMLLDKRSNQRDQNVSFECYSSS